MNKKPRQKFKYFEDEKKLSAKLSAKNFLRPESASLMLKN